MSLSCCIIYSCGYLINVLGIYTVTYLDILKIIEQNRQNSFLGNKWYGSVMCIFLSVPVCDSNVISYKLIFHVFEV